MKLWKTATAALLAVAGTAAQAARIPDQYIVTLDAKRVQATGAPGGIRQASQALVASVGGGEVLHVYQHALTGFAARIPAVAADALRRSPLVVRIEPDQRFTLNVAQTPVPSYGIDRIDQANLPLNNTYDYPASAGAGAHVYIIDTGLRASHVDFAGRVGEGRNFAPGQGSVLCQLLGIGCPAPVATDTSDCNGHGTHVAGSAAGSSFGVAKGATVHAVRVFGCGNSTATSTIIAGVDWVTATHPSHPGPAAANMSLGGAASAALDTAVSNMIASGVQVAIAAGNDNVDACGQSPGRVAAGITVGSTTNTDARSSFSNFGTCLDLFAPGSNIVSATNANDTGSATLSGTSMASPHVAGAIARYQAAHPGATPAQVHAAIVGNSTAGVVGGAGTGSPNRLLYVSPAGD